jgi:hypothetical protein
MTEQEWLECTDSIAMFEFFRGTRLDSRLRRFAVECCRRIRHLIAEEVFRVAADAAEAFADDPRNKKSTIKPMAMASIQGWRHHIRNHSTISADPHQLRAANAALGTCASYDWQAAYIAMRESAQALNRVNANDYDRVELEYQANLLRCVFGNPFRPITMNPAWKVLAWNDGTVRKIAQSIYEERAFDRLPILADALTDAGCDHADLLNHCRSEGPHVKGCWVVDLLLGKE